MASATPYEGQSSAAWLAESLSFPVYEQYGLSYDEKSGYLMYDNKKVGYFKDELQPDTFCRFVEKTGEIGVVVTRDEDWKITGMETVPMSEVMSGDSTIEFSSTDSNETASTTEENTAAVISEGDAQSTHADIVPQSYVNW